MQKLKISWLIFIFILGTSFPSFLSIPSKSRESGGVVLSEYHNKEFRCLVEALVYEAFGEPLEGIEAVLSVIVNRKNITGKSFCSIIRQPRQFSFRNNYDKEIDLPLEKFINHSKYKEVQYLAYQAHEGKFEITLPPNTIHFVGKNHKIGWVKNKKLVKIIGGHAFYN